MKKARADFETAVLRLFLRYLRAEAVCSSPPSGEVDPAQPYVDYLRKERGLAKNSILVYAPFVRDFLTYASPETLDAQVIQDFLLDRIRNRSSEYARLLTVALRSFLRFLHLRGEAPTDFSSAVPMVRKWSQARITPFLSPDEVEHIISGTSCGRDRAILLLLARLGLRAGEVVALELGDILWRSGEIVIRGKGRMQDRLPLLEDVGEALALYIRDDRSASSSRRVFLRVYAPRVGLAGPAAVGHVVRLALRRAGLHPDRGAAHLFPSQHRDEDDPSWRVDRRDIGGPPASIHGHHPDLHEGGFRVTADCCPTLAGRRRMTIHEALARYIAIRRSLGSRLREPAMTLGHFVDLLEREGMDFITTDIAVRWAQESQGVQRATWSRRLSMVRQFAAWLHPFATQKLIEWYREGLDVARELPKLSTYLGHVDVSNTYWYIEAVPELLSLATERASEGGAR
jgi:integrase